MKEERSATNACLPDGRSLIYDYGCWRGVECGWAPQRWRASCWSYVPSPPPPPPPSPSYRSAPPGHASSSQSCPQAPVMDTCIIKLLFRPHSRSRLKLTILPQAPVMYTCMIKLLFRPHSRLRLKLTILPSSSCNRHIYDPATVLSSFQVTPQAHNPSLKFL
jgi:hypothetical protein